MHPIIKSLWFFFYVSCIRKDDDFAVQMQKVVVTVGLFAAPVSTTTSVATLLHAVTVSETQTDKILAWARGLATFSFAASCVTAWIYMKRDHELPSKAIRYCLSSLTACCMFYTISNTASHYCTIHHALAVIAVLTCTDEVLYVMLAAILLMINAYNLSLGEQTGTFIGTSSKAVTMRLSKSSVLPSLVSS
eukprot:PhM_4_TR14222/c0_g1_i5/m.66622